MAGSKQAWKGSQGRDTLEGGSCEYFLYAWSESDFKKAQQSGSISRLCELEKLKHICCVKLYLFIFTAIVSRGSSGWLSGGAQSIYEQTIKYLRIGTNFNDGLYSINLLLLASWWLVDRNK